MRIFYASDSTPNPFFQSNLWRNNLYLPLVDLGHDVVEFEYDLRETFQNLLPEDPKQKEFIEHNRPVVSEELLRQIRGAHATNPIQLFFSYFNDACVLPETIDEIRRMGITTVNWYCNGSYQLELVSGIAPHYDWCLVPEAFRLSDYAAMGAKPIYCQEAANPNIYKPHDVPVEHDVTFVGQAYGDRPAYIQHLLDENIDVRVWGYDWERYTVQEIPPANPPRTLQRVSSLLSRLTTAQGRRSIARRFVPSPPANAVPQESSLPEEEKGVLLPRECVGGVLSDAEMIQMYSRSKINLGFSTCGSTHLSDERIMQIRLRDFEVPMSGGFYMVEYMEELEDFFEIGKEVVCYSSVEDVSDKIEYYLRHDSERERIRRAGHERCLRDHTWQKRFKDAFKSMGLSEE
jgi:spore maturation protein CgeB